MRNENKETKRQMNGGEVGHGRSLVFTEFALEFNVLRFA